MKRRGKSETNTTYYKKENKRRSKLPMYGGVRIEGTYTPYTLRWWLEMLGKAEQEHHLAIMDGDVFNGMRFVSLWGWIQERIIRKYGE